MLLTFSPIFLADTKVILVCNIVAPLSFTTKFELVFVFTQKNDFVVEVLF